MELQEMRKLETEVKGLQQLMQEVHRNQVVLNRVLLSGRVSRSNVGPGDPKGAKGPGAGMMLSSLQSHQAPGPQTRTEERREEGKRRKWNSPSVSGSNQTSEDSPDEKRLVRKQKDNLSPGSSFIRNILDEDSRAGVAVVDLFLTVKMAKDNLKFLSRSNSEVFDKINYLKQETVAIGVGYKDLMEDMQNLLGRMSESVSQKRKSVHARGEKSKFKFWKDVQERGFEDEGTPTGSRGSEDETESWGRTRRSGRKGGCVGCFVSAHKAALFQELPELSEASLTSFLTTLLWMQKGRERFCETCECSAHRPERQQSDWKLSSSAYRMFHDICQVLDGAAREDLGSDQDPTETDDSPASRNGGRRTSRPNFCRRKLLRSGRSARNLRRDASESESEDAITPRPLTGLGLKAKPSVTCMGDLTRAVPGKKSASTLTTASNGFRKPSSAVRNKMKRIRSKKCLKIEGSKKLRGKPDLKMKVGPSTHKLHALCNVPGVKRCLVDPALRRTTRVHAALAPNAAGTFPNAFDDPAGIDYLSDDSFYNCDSESLAAGSRSGDEDLEEFVEIFNKSSKAVGKISAPKSFLGLLHETTLKTIKALFFEIQKCYPANFVQEILPKRVEERPKESSEDLSISLSPGEHKQKKVVIEGSSTDFVLYIQVELEEGSSPGSREVLICDQSTQPCIRMEEEEEDEHHDVWQECEGSRHGEMEERITFEEPPQEEQEIRNTYPEGKVMAAMEVLELKDEKRRADVWLLQNSAERLFLAIGREHWGPVETKPPELEKALNLIREIENDVVDEKLNDAISILPRLEWELRKHVQSKVKESGGSNGMTDLLPLTDLWPEPSDSGRMQNLLTILRELETAIKATESSVDDVALRQYDSSRVYDLIHALVSSIRDLEENSSMSNVSQTLEIASQLDTAVREYDGVMKTLPGPESGRNRKRKEDGTESVPAKRHLRNVRKKVFETVEDEAARLERRVERSMARMNVLEKENDEAMTFLEAFLQKTKRRMSELTSLKVELKKLSSTLRDMHANLAENIARKKERKTKPEPGKPLQVGRSRSETENPGRVPEHSQSKETVVRETVSGLLFALDSLKSRAREKKELCREILSPPIQDKVRDSASSSRRSSRSSFTARHADTLTSSLKEFRKVDQNRLYLEWTSPEGSLKDFVSGFEIYVNGKLNHKVRNPRRLQALLYSIDPTESVHLELYAVAENRPKILLISEHRLESRRTPENSQKF